MASGDTTTVIVEGMRREKRLAVAASMVCKVCCDEGSGSGAGSGGDGSGSGAGSGISGDDPRCCGCTDLNEYPATINITLNVACGLEVTLVCTKSSLPSCEPVGVPNLEYSGADSATADTVSIVDSDCDGLTTGGEVSNFLYNYQADLYCVPCTTTGNHVWVISFTCIARVGTDRVQVYGTTTLTLVSCNPLSWSTKVMNIVCYSSTPTLNDPCCSNGEYDFCGADAWTFNQLCSGSTITITASE